MRMSPGLRKFTLMTHVASSVGWLGAVGAFLALAVAGVVRDDAVTLQAVNVAMDLIGWFVIVPLCLASVLSGLAQSLGTEWGLIRHYWVLMKALITIPCSVLLIPHIRPARQLAEAAVPTILATPELNVLQIELAADAAAAFMALLITVALAVYKPRGFTRYGWRKQHDARPLHAPS
jgi:hypothetical protein